MTTKKIALAIVAHPDDAEFFCAGTLALLRENGWQIHIATMTAGDCGTMQLTREQISRIRKDEATRASAMLDGTYHCMECDDLLIMYDRPNILRLTELIRKVKPTIVFTLPHDDYMVDHTTTGKLTMTACFSCGIPNIHTPGHDPFEPVPYLYYTDPAEGKDKFGKPVKPTTIVDIAETFETKKQMLACHDSQRSWLLQHHGMDEYLESMERWTRHHSKLINAKYVEGFRQHLGHAFPQDNILADELGNIVHIVKEKS